MYNALKKYFFYELRLLYRKNITIYLPKSLLNPYFITLYVFISVKSVFAQDSIPLSESFLETVEIKASRQIDIKYFIRQTMNDKTFYIAFKNLRKTNYTADNNIVFRDKKNNEKASYKSRTIQRFTAKKCRFLQETDKQITGDFYTKNEVYNYYTMKMFARLFFQFDTICSGADTSTNAVNSEMQTREAQLRTLIFNPGKKVTIPIIGNKLAIFSDEMQPYYQYTFEETMYGNQPAYLFSAKVKPEWSYKEHKSKTVIKSFDTYFSRDTKQVLGRKYKMKYAYFLFDFDVFMQIDLTKKGNEYLPQKVYYKGVWDIPFKKIENSDFNILFHY